MTDFENEWGTPVWEPPATVGSGTLPDRVGILIIGGGITGVSLLRELPDAWLVEAEHLAFGATGRNAGFLLAGVASNYADAVAQYGRSLAGEIWAFTTRNRERVLETLHGRAEARRRGSWTVAASAGESDSLREAVQLMDEDGFRSEWHGDDAFGRLLNPDDAELHPARAVGELAAGLEDRIVEGYQVEDLGDAAGRADVVILAVNGYARRLAPELPIEPVRGQMLATAPSDQPRVDRPAYADRGYQYWRQRADGRVLVGGYRNTAPQDELGFGSTPTEPIQRHLDMHLRSIDPDLEVTHRWAGTMGFTPDGLPLVGEVPGRPGVYVCGGYTGHGMGFAFNCAQLLAQHLQGGPRPPAWLDPGRFPPETEGPS